MREIRIGANKVWMRHGLRILGNKRLKSFGILNGQGSRSWNGLGILHYLPDFLNYTTTRGLFLHT